MDAAIAGNAPVNQGTALTKDEVPHLHDVGCVGPEPDGSSPAVGDHELDATTGEEELSSRETRR